MIQQSASRLDEMLGFAIAHLSLRGLKKKKGLFMDMSATGIDTGILQMHLPWEDKAFIIELLDKSGIEYSEWMLKADVGALIDVIKNTAADAGPWAFALSYVIGEYLKSKSKRKVSIVVGKQTVSLEGYSPDEIREILPQVSSIIISK